MPSEPMYCAAQMAFFKKVRGEIDKNKSMYFQSHTWHNIMPSGGRFDSSLLNVSVKRKAKVDAFYVQAMASWVPHFLFSNHVPCCPTCKKRDYVDPSKGRWINSPKVVFGLHRNKFLDTWLYYCRGCMKSFAGYNKQSMQLDADKYYGFFNFFIGRGYAVDEELYRFIVLESATEATATIATRIQRMCYDAYFADYQHYLSAVGFGKIDTRPKKKGRTMDNYITVTNSTSTDTEAQLQ